MLGSWQGENGRKKVENPWFRLFQCITLRTFVRKNMVIVSITGVDFIIQIFPIFLRDRRSDTSFFTTAPLYITNSSSS